MIEREVVYILIGAGIALVSSIVTALVQHFLSLRADRIKRVRERELRESEKLRRHLSEGIGFQLSEINRQLLKHETDLREILSPFRDVTEAQSFELERLTRELDLPKEALRLLEKLQTVLEHSQQGLKQVAFHMQCIISDMRNGLISLILQERIPEE